MNELQRCNKAEVFDTGRSNQYPVDPNFFWVTQDGEVIHPRHMRTMHLFNCLKMIWNHTVPAQYHVLPFNHKYVIRMPRAEQKRAVRNLFCELMNRGDRTAAMDATIKKMAEYIVEKKYRKGNKTLAQRL